VTSVVHDRMPVILDPDDVILDPDGYGVWLDPGMQNVAAVSELLKPCDARAAAVLSREHADQPRGER
jgi:putative SOS response-associated peptidase YedK